MADNNSSNNDRPTPKPRTIVGKTLDLVFKIIGIIIFSAIISIIVEWIGMVFFYPEEGYHHAEGMMKQEMEYLVASIGTDELNKDAVDSARGTIETVTGFVFIDSGIIDALMSIKTPSPDDGEIIAVAKSYVADLYDYLMAAVFILAMFIIRFAILVLSIPAFLLFGLVGVSDGLMKRDLRRWCGGNESGFIYHWAKRFAVPVLIAAWLIYLAIPASIHPNYIITPFAVLFGLVLMVMSSKFKKYL